MYPGWFSYLFSPCFCQPFFLRVPICSIDWLTGRFPRQSPWPPQMDFWGPPCSVTFEVALGHKCRKAASWKWGKGGWKREQGLRWRVWHRKENKNFFQFRRGRKEKTWGQRPFGRTCRGLRASRWENCQEMHKVISASVDRTAGHIVYTRWQIWGLVMHKFSG